MKDLFDSIDQAIEMNEKLSSENNRLTMALQEIREYKYSMDVESYESIFDIAKKALSNDVSIEHEGHLYVFGETTVEVAYLDDVNPFERVKETS